MPPAVRGKWSAYLSLITNSPLNSPLFVSTFLGYLIIPSIGWRAMFAIVGIGAMIVWGICKKMPESPRWLESKGRHEEAEAESTRVQPLLPLADVPRTLTQKTSLRSNCFRLRRFAAPSSRSSCRSPSSQYGDLRFHRLGGYRRFSSSRESASRRRSATLG